MDILIIAHFIVSVMLIGSVLLQSPGGGLGATFGGSAAYHTKRGVEKGLFTLTIVLSVVFTVLSILVLL